MSHTDLHRFHSRLCVLTICVSDFAMEVSVAGIRVSVLILATLLCVCRTTEVSQEAPSDYFVKEMLVRAQHHLTSDLYRAVARHHGNVVISPWSVMSMLTVAYILAGGRTASEIKEHLKIPLLSRKELFEGFHNIYGMFEDHNHSSEIIESVSAAFVGGGLNAPQRIQKNLQQNLNTFVDHTTITNSYDSADRNATTSTSVTPEEAINDFVIKKTRGLIGELITPGTIQANQTALWLFNVLYFQGTWQHKFNPRMTHPAEFKVDGKHPVKVPTMMVKAEIPRNHFPDLEMTVLELPYGHDGLYSLFLLLPDKDDGLPELERRLKHLRLQNVLSSQHWARLTKVFLPKFKFEKETDLMEAMRRLGFKKMFQPGDAYFSRLTGQCNDSAYVTKIEHKAVIEVNEDGTRAAAATAVRLTARRFAFNVRVNHPFMFVLRDKRLGINLFVGRVTDPRQLS